MSDNDSSSSALPSTSSSQLPAHPSLEQLRKQAKDLLKQFRSGDSAARERFHKHRPESSSPILADAQLVLAREHGFESWPKLVRHVQGVSASDRVKKFERLATDISRAYNGDATSLAAVNDVFGRTLTFEQARDLIARRMKVLRGSTDEDRLVELTSVDAQLLVARQHGFANWSEFVASFSRPPHDPRSLSHGMSSTPPFYRIDWATNTISPGPMASDEDWNAVIDLIKELRITGVSAEGRMTDKALERISRIDHVTRLHLGGTGRISDAGLKHLHHMPQLQEMELGDYPGGQITDRGLEFLRHTQDLRSFRMTWQRAITDAGVSNLEFCDRLEEVDLLGTHTGNGVLKALAGKPNLRRLKTGRLITDEGLPLLHQFPAFKSYHGGEVIAELMTFEAQPNNLLIDGPFTSNGLENLKGLEGLFALSFFWHTNVLRGKDLMPLAYLPHLGFLGCQGELCDDDAMKHIAALPRLRVLMGQGTVASDDGFASLSRSRTIEYIWGRECPNLSGRGFMALSNMPSLRGLAVSCKNVYDKSLSTLPRFPSLTELMPMDVEDPGFRHVGKCEKLESLVMMYCRNTTDIATEHIKGLTRLRKYYAGSTKITDRSLEILGGMESLEQVLFDNCAGITDDGLVFLAGLPKLKEVSIDGSPQVTRAGLNVFGANVNVKFA